MKKRICSILLVLALLLGLVPNVAFAAEENENLALNATVLGVSKDPPNDKEHARYALDGNPWYTKWCAVAPAGWMVFKTGKPVKPEGLMVYHAGYGADTVKHNIKEYQLEVLNTQYLSEADFLNMNEQEQGEVMRTQYYWTTVIDPVVNWTHSRYSMISMPEARSVFRFNVTVAARDDVIRVYELELLAHAPVPESVNLEPITLQENQTVELRPYFIPNHFNEPVTYSIADPEIAVEVDGKLVAKKIGTTEITVTAVNYPQIQTTTTVTVIEEICRDIWGYAPLWWEKFEGETMPEGWTAEDIDGDGVTWGLYKDGKAHHGKQCVYSGRLPDAEGHTSDWLISPEFLVGHNYMFDLMASGSAEAVYRDEVLFYILEEGKEPEVLGDQSYFLDGFSWYELNASLEKYEGRRVRVAFAHNSDTPKGGMYVDCVALCREALIEYPAKVTFKIENGTWDGQDKADKVQEVLLKDGFGTLPEDAVPTGMQPDPGYHKGHWDYTPNVDENGIIGNIVYTYIFEEKKDSATVTFQVVNGTFAGTDPVTDTRQVTVKLNDGKGTLSPEDVPEPFEMRPRRSYGFGAWDVIPNTEKDALTEDVTYQYIFDIARDYENGVAVCWEGFEGAAMPEGWTVEDRDGDGCSWEISTEGVHHGQQSVASIPCSTAEDFVPNNWLITPEFLVGHKYEFEVMRAIVDKENKGKVELYVLEDGKEPVQLKRHTSVVSSHDANTANAKSFVNLRGDLSAYEGRRVRVAIVHNAGSPDIPLYLDCAALWREDLSEHMSKVVFRVENGTWDGQDKADKVQEVLLKNGHGTLPAAAVPTGMQPDHGYEKGSWNMVPNVDKNGVVGDIVYTYTFQQDPAARDHATVTFQVVNGKFRETKEEVRQVQVKLENGKGTLSPEDVPDPSDFFSRPGYGCGAWDVVPNTGKNAVTQDVTYQYIFVPVYELGFNLLGCTWADGSGNTIYCEIPKDGDRPVYLTADQVPTGMIPDEDHLPTGGNWYVGGNPMTRIDNILEYPITENDSFCYSYEGKHTILLDRTLFLGGGSLVARVQTDLTELVCDDEAVKIEVAFENPDFTFYRVEVPNVPKTYTLKALDPTDGNKEITAQVRVLAESPFTDVREDHWFSEAVIWAVEHGITDGFPDGTFKPNAHCTRAQIVTFLWRSEGTPEPKTTKSPFTDVDADDWFFKPVMWAVENGITDGFPDGSFKPQDPCTRAQAVTFLYRLYGYEPENFEWADLESMFPDVKKEWYYDAVMWASYSNILGGFPDGTFRPKDACTRAQIVTLLYRLS